MFSARMEAAEEIQLLLPDNQPGPRLDSRSVLLLGIGVLLIAIPVCGLGLLGKGTAAS